MSATFAGWLLLGLAIGLLVAGAYPAAVLVALTDLAIVVTEPGPAHRAARDRNPRRGR